MASIKLKGDTSGEITIQAPSVAGTNTLNLQASSGTLATTAQASVGTKNRIINGNFDVWQRGTSFTITASTNTYTADRWRFVGSAFTGTLTRQSFTSGQTDVPNNPDYFASWNVTTNAAGNVGFTQYIENVRTLAGKTATVSFYLKSNSTIAANTLNLRYRHVTGGTGGSSTSVNIGEITTSWQKFTFTINIPSLSGATLGASNSSYLAMDIISPTAHTSAFQVDIAQVQVEEGDTATPFENRMYSTELAMCQRYYYKTNTTTSSDRYAFFYPARVTSTTQATVCATYPTMRTSPSITQSGTGINIGPQGATTAFTGSWVTPSSAWIDVTVSGVSMTAGQCVMLNANNNANAYVAMDAEL